MARTSFVELPACDLGAARTFYESVFGWEMTGFRPSYACTMSGDVDLGLQGDAGEATAAPLVVVAVDDLDVAQVSVEAAGGMITKPIFGFPEGRRFHFRDPNGLELAAWRAEQGLRRRAGRRVTLRVMIHGRRCRVGAVTYIGNPCVT